LPARRCCHERCPSSRGQFLDLDDLVVVEIGELARDAVDVDLSPAEGADRGFGNASRE
jgi:hypothetical protein